MVDTSKYIKNLKDFDIFATNNKDFILIIKDRVNSLNTLNNLELIKNAGEQNKFFSTVLTGVFNFCCY